MLLYNFICPVRYIEQTVYSAILSWDYLQSTLVLETNICLVPCADALICSLMVYHETPGMSWSMQQVSSTYFILASDNMCLNTRLFLQPHTNMHMQHSCRTLCPEPICHSFLVLSALGPNFKETSLTVLLSRCVTSAQELPSLHLFNQANRQIHIASLPASLLGTGKMLSCEADWFFPL